MTTTEQKLSFLDVLDRTLASVKLPSVQTNIFETEIIEKVHKSFAVLQNMDDGINRSAREKKMIEFIQNRLQYMADHADRLQVNQNQLKVLFELSSDADVLQLLSAYYACFYLARSKSTSSDKMPLLNELLCAAYYDIIEMMIEKKMPHYENLSRRMIMQLRTSDDKTVNPMKDIINHVAHTYHLTVEDILVYFENRTYNPKSFEKWSQRILLEYMEEKLDPKNATFDNFFREKNLRDLFNDEEVEKYNLLFNAYITKLVNRHIGKFSPKKSKSTDIAGNNSGVKPFPEPQPAFPIDLFDVCHIMVIWLDSHIGLDENCRDLKREFTKLTNSFKFENTVEGCRKHLPNIKDRKVFFIIQGKLAKNIVPDIEKIIPDEMEPVVYLFCGQMTNYTEWAQDYMSIMRGNIFDHEKDLLGRLTKDLNEYALKVIKKYVLNISKEYATNFIGTSINMSERCYQRKVAFEFSNQSNIVAY